MLYSPLIEAEVFPTEIKQFLAPLVVFTPSIPSQAAPHIVHILSCLPDSLIRGRFIEEKIHLCYYFLKRTREEKKEAQILAGDHKQYKDRLFNFLFGSEENREWTLSLYNAVNNSHYTDPSAIEFTTIKEVMYLGMHNDVSFLIAGEMNLYEQQSSYNPNMPLRLLQYAGNLYEKYVKQHKLNKYGSALLMLPIPKLVVFYNGNADQSDEQILRLSDSFPKGADSDIEVKVRMLNVNSGRNQRLLETCKPLGEYSWLVEEIRKNNKTKDQEGAGSAIDLAISEMPDSFVIKPFLVAHRAEVKGMLLTEYNEAEQMELFKEDGRREGRVEGILDTLASLVKDGILSIKDAAARAGVSEDIIKKKKGAK